MVHNFTAEIIHDNEINQFIGIVPVLKGAHSQAPTLDELYRNLEEVVRLVLLEMSTEEKEFILS
jgi:predicted RNase H-like HicB family nuclease